MAIYSYLTRCITLCVCALLLLSIFSCFGVYERVGESSDFKIIQLRGCSQKYDFSCGSASVASVLNYWGYKVTDEKIVKDQPPKSINRGYSAAELLKILDDYQMKAFLTKGSKYNLLYEIRNGRPVIVPVKIPVVSISSFLFAVTAFVPLST